MEFRPDEVEIQILGAVDMKDKRLDLIDRRFSKSKLMASHLRDARIDRAAQRLAKRENVAESTVPT